MNYVRIALAAIAAWVVSLGLDFLINNIWLVRLYEANSWAYRHAEQMTPLLPIGFGVQFVGCVAFAYAYARGYKGDGFGTAEGVIFGLVVACMVDGFAVVWNYVTQPIAARLGYLQLVSHFGEFGVLGAVVGLIYRPRTPAQAESTDLLT